jgi:hypothetical protein
MRHLCGGVLHCLTCYLLVGVAATSTGSTCRAHTVHCHVVKCCCLQQRCTHKYPVAAMLGSPSDACQRHVGRRHCNAACTLPGGIAAHAAATAHCRVHKRLLLHCGDLMSELIRHLPRLRQRPRLSSTLLRGLLHGFSTSQGVCSRAGTTRQRGPQNCAGMAPPYCPPSPPGAGSAR